MQHISGEKSGLVPCAQGLTERYFLLQVLHGEYLFGLVSSWTL